MSFLPNILKYFNIINFLELFLNGPINKNPLYIVQIEKAFALKISWNLFVFFFRYVDYFAGLLSHNIKINAAPMYLTHVTVLGAPAFQQGGCKAFLKLYQGQTAVYTSGKTRYSIIKLIMLLSCFCRQRSWGIEMKNIKKVNVIHSQNSSPYTCSKATTVSACIIFWSSCSVYHFPKYNNYVWIVVTSYTHR